MADIDDDEDLDEVESKEFVRATHAVMILRCSFQSLVGATGAVKKVVKKHGAEVLGDGTAGMAVRVPTDRLPLLFVDLSKTLAATFTHKYSKEDLKGYEGFDNWSISIQAEKPKKV